MATAGSALFAVRAKAADLLGQPTPGGIDLQPAASPLKHDAIFFHNAILMPIITVIMLFVLGLLIICIVRFNKRANPVPARWSHNTMIEVIWTAAPVLILMFIAIFSFRLLFEYQQRAAVLMTVKVTGYQWYWGYEYPDQKISEITSTILPEEDAKAKGVPYRLAATEPLVAPVGKVVRVQVHRRRRDPLLRHAGVRPEDGRHPGRLNETWFKAEKTGTYYGQCSELCGVDHGFMPIEIKIVSQADFDAWGRQQEGSAGSGRAGPRQMPPRFPAAAPATTPAAATAATPAA